MKKGNKKWQTVYLSIGSNLGNRKANLNRAIRMLEKNPELKVEKIAPIYETSPIGPKQREFLNSAIKLKTCKSPFQLLSALKKIEREMGRKRGVRWGPRIIDLDILFYDKFCLKSKKLTLPHSEFYRRKFVLAPLSEIAPNFLPPGFRHRIRELNHQLTDPAQKVKLYREKENCPNLPDKKTPRGQ